MFIVTQNESLFKLVYLKFNESLFKDIVKRVWKWKEKGPSSPVISKSQTPASWGQQTAARTWNISLTVSAPKRFLCL